MQPAAAITSMRFCDSRHVSVLCCISIQMKSCPSHAFLAASRSGSEIVLLNTCLPALSFVSTVLNVTDPAGPAPPPGPRPPRPPGAGAGAAPAAGAGAAANAVPPVAVSPRGGPTVSAAAANTSRRVGSIVRLQKLQESEEKD